jgi:hypothetical protein
LPAGITPPGADRDRHHVVEVEVPDMAVVLDRAGVVVTTMGRGPGADPLYFAAAGAAGIVAAGRARP